MYTVQYYWIGNGTVARISSASTVGFVYSPRVIVKFQIYIKWKKMIFCLLISYCD